MEEPKITRVNRSSHKSISTHSGITLKKHPVQLCFCTDTSTVILLLPPSWQRVVKPIQTKMSEEFEVGGRKWLLMVILFICRCANGLYGNILDPGQNMKGIADLIWLASEALSGHDAMTHKYTSQFILVQKEKKTASGCCGCYTWTVFKEHIFFLVSTVRRLVTPCNQSDVHSLLHPICTNKTNTHTQIT